MHLKNKYGVNQLDFVIITHPHIDHIDDILNFDALSPKVLLRPSSIQDDKLLQGIRSYDRPKIEKYIEINNRFTTNITGQSVDPDDPYNFGGLKISTFIPFYLGDNLNNYSIVTVFEYAGLKVVVPGDNEKSSLDQLMGRQSFKDAIQNADILLAPHHGRDSGYNNDFVTLVNPRLVIVSDGKFCDTSANPRYSAKSRGWNVYKNGMPYSRKCLTTNSDGEVYVKFGYDESNERFFNVRI